MQVFAAGCQMSASVSSVPQTQSLPPNNLCITWVQKALISAAQMKWSKGVNTPDFK